MKPIWLWPICLILLFESTTKGWLSLIMLPLLVIVIPLLVVLTLFTRRVVAHGNQPFLSWMQWLTIVGVLAFYIAMPAVGDTNDTVLLGFIPGNITSPITTILGNIGYIGFFIACLTALGQTVAIITGYRQIKLSRQSKPELPA